MAEVVCVGLTVFGDFEVSLCVALHSTVHVFCILGLRWIRVLLFCLASRGYAGSMYSSGVKASISTSSAK